MIRKVLNLLALKINLTYKNEKQQTLLYFNAYYCFSFFLQYS
ncbi:hypothetical protein TASCI_150020 [Tenacibaculum ascidiaceicola]